ncbi:alpha/beta fold hydrolase [Planktotalea arctica]|uniref:alpha/beta fold hydrolase n=1 Tax=Planktotalea arctica TaxID=1481893 RepID=UPI00321C2804
MLNVLTYGTDTARPPLMIVHGLFGSARNWNVIARRMSETRRVIAPDLRNHGNSFQADSHSYPDMAADLSKVIDAHGGVVDLLGHSMGGKAAMVLALKQPEQVARLLVADIAPVAYGHSQQHFIDAMRAVDLSQVSRRADASAQLARHVNDKTLQSFFTQSLDVKEKRWLYNLDVLERDMALILGFPEIESRYDGLALFLSGANSDYVLPKHRPLIRSLFPGALFAKIPDAGHWLHAEQPRAFEASLRAFLDYRA